MITPGGRFAVKYVIDKVSLLRYIRSWCTAGSAWATLLRGWGEWFLTVIAKHAQVPDETGGSL